MILFDKNVNNLINSLTFLRANLKFIDDKFLKQEGLFAKLISLMRFLEIFKFNLHIQ